MSIEETIRLAVREEIRSALDELRRATGPAATPAPAVDDRLTTEEVAARCKVLPQTVRTWIQSGRLLAGKTGAKYLVRPTDLEAFLIRQHEAGPVADVNEQAARILGRIKGRSNDG